MKNDPSKRLIEHIGDQYVSLAADSVEAFTAVRQTKTRGRVKLWTATAACALLSVLVMIVLLSGVLNQTDSPVIPNDPFTPGAQPEDPSADTPGDAPDDPDKPDDPDQPDQPDGVKVGEQQVVGDGHDLHRRDQHHDQHHHQQTLAAEFKAGQSVADHTAGQQGEDGGDAAELDGVQQILEGI